MAEPAVNELKRALAATFPEIFPGQDPLTTKPMPRLQSAAGDHRSNPNYDSSKDPHAAGLALDIFLLVGVERERKLRKTWSTSSSTTKTRWAGMLSSITR